MDAAEVAARVEIADLVARYNAQGDAGRLDALLDLFTPDATLAVDSERNHGHDAIRALFEAATASTRLRSAGILRHFTATHQVDFDDALHARGRCYFQALTESGLDHWGRYRDRYVRAESGWRFAERLVEVEGRVAGGWADTRMRAGH